ERPEPGRTRGDRGPHEHHDASGRRSAGEGARAARAAGQSQDQLRGRHALGHDARGRFRWVGAVSYRVGVPPRRDRSRSIAGPDTMTIMALVNTPTSVETKASALRMSVAPMVASRTP